MYTNIIFIEFCIYSILATNITHTYSISDPSQNTKPLQYKYNKKHSLYP